MRTSGFALGIMTLVAGLPILVQGGNRAMMENNANALIEINREVLQQLRVGGREGEYRLVARVVTRDGERVILVDRLETPTGHPGAGSDRGKADALPLAGEEVAESGQDKRPTRGGAARVRFAPIPIEGMVIKPRDTQ